jgi:Tol biopolymer transport system component
MLRATAAALAGLLVLAPAGAAPQAKPVAPRTFLVEESGELRLLGPDGTETERLDPPSTNAALSPDGRWLAGVEFDRDRSRCALVLRPRGRAGDPVTVPLLWDRPGRSGSLPVWAADGARLLVGENQPGPGGRPEYAHRVYDLAAKALTDLKLPAGCWVTGWSPDGKRLLATVAPGDGSSRLAWVAAGGGGEPEFLTPADEIAYDGRLSPDGKRVLCLIGPKSAKGKKGKADRPRLTVIELATGQRVEVDQPGYPHGHCWSPDGSRVAYTWQRPLVVPTHKRETLLITCTADGKDRKVVASRRHTLPPDSTELGTMVYFFTVVAWW